MEVINLSEQNSIFNTYLSEIRDEQIQKDPMRFRENIRRMGMLLGYEVSRRMDFINRSVVTPLGVAEVPSLSEQPVVASILRAGIPLHLGVLDLFDRADNAFISAYRKTNPDHSFEIKVEYLASPSLENRTLLLCDPMLATGRSMVLCYEAMKERGNPKHTHLISLIGSEEGIEHVREEIEGDVTLWIGAIDEELNAKSYIVPGLGDAGDLAFGQKEG
jgi:uracil phosphoribosyltransferase